jgi:hypothetical protein
MDRSRRPDPGWPRRIVTKHPDNPVLTFIPIPGGSNAQEEGIFSAVALSDAGQVTLCCSGLTMTDGPNVRSDIYRTASDDGVTFAPAAKVLDAEASELWGNEGRDNEICPAGLFKHDGMWNLYYLTKNRKRAVWDRLTGKNDGIWDYGMVSGPGSERLDGSRQVLLQEESMLGGEYRQLSAIQVGAGQLRPVLGQLRPGGDEDQSRGAHGERRSSGRAGRSSGRLYVPRRALRDRVPRRGRGQVAHVRSGRPRQDRADPGQDSARSLCAAVTESGEGAVAGGDGYAAGWGA